jgi:hypothetical protein
MIPAGARVFVSTQAGGLPQRSGEPDGPRRGHGLETGEGGERAAPSGDRLTCGLMTQGRV